MYRVFSSLHTKPQLKYIAPVIALTNSHVFNRVFLARAKVQLGFSRCLCK